MNKPLDLIQYYRGELNKTLNAMRISDPEAVLHFYQEAKLLLENYKDQILNKE